MRITKDVVTKETGPVQSSGPPSRLAAARIISIRVLPIVFLALGGCMAQGSMPASKRTRLIAPISRLTHEVLARVDRGANPATLSRPFAWRVDRRGRIDLVTVVRPGAFAQTIRWVVERHGRVIAEARSDHLFEAWIPARIVFRLARKPAVQGVRFPHYAMIHH
jgi:hypothetical protein